jgi:hypothetical protein
MFSIPSIGIKKKLRRVCVNDSKCLLEQSFQGSLMTYSTLMGGGRSKCAVTREEIFVRLRIFKSHSGTTGRGIDLSVSVCITLLWGNPRVGGCVGGLTLASARVRVEMESALVTGSHSYQ